MNYSLEHRTDKYLSGGNPAFLGATVSQDGVNFALFSQYAKEVYLLLFANPDGPPTDIIKLESKTDNVWHVFVKGIKTGQLYGYKIKGDYNPKEGMRFNPHKLLIDPYAKALTGKFNSADDLLFAYDKNSPDKDLKMDERDNTNVVPKSIVIDDTFDWRDDLKPQIPMQKLIIYEVHLKGFTAHKSSKVKQPGTYLGFVEKIPYLKELGVNAVELLPIHEHYVQDYLIKKGLTNYWGYDSIGFFTPESSYSSQEYPGCQVQEFKTLVQALHRAGIEVILDVVYNHTAEGNEAGPTLCFKGIDNPSYYYLVQNNPEESYRRYSNDSGCGNTFNAENPAVMRLILDSLRYWVEVMHVDGFRFDEASILARVKGQFSQNSAFFEAISKDPVLSKVKMIAEPWDLTTYQVGNFPKMWSEWNGKFRDTVRKFIKGDDGQAPDMAKRLTGSADLYQDDGRKPYNSINFVTCHDGFTLRDLFTYNSKHNEANLEDNKDGIAENYSWNCGAEGETKDRKIIDLRMQMAKNAFCCLLFSSGTPMILGGDEFMRTQKGNNNVWCQDNELTWFDWGLKEQNPDIAEFCKKAIDFRKRYSILERRRFFTGKDNNGDRVPDIAWFGRKLEGSPKWDSIKLKTFCFQLCQGEESSQTVDHHLFFILNANHRGSCISLPPPKEKKWYRVIDTSCKTVDDFFPPGKEELLKVQENYYCAPRTVVVLLGR